MAKKIDANEILKNGGNDSLNSALDEIDAESEKEFEQLEESMAKEQQAAELKKAAREKAAADKKILTEIFSGNLSDLSNSNRLYILYGKIIRRNIDTGNWLVYENGKWREIGKDNDELLFLTLKVAEYIQKNRPQNSLIHNDDGSIVQDLTKPQYKNEFVNFGTALSNQWQKLKIQRNAIALLKGNEKIRIKQEDLDKNPFLLNVKNGVLDLEKGVLYPAAPELLLTKQANVIFNPRATCPVFNKFMQEIIPDEQTRAAVLRWLGYSLTGSVREEKALFVHGKGGNGKGTLFDTINYLLGDYATTFNVEMILRQKFSANANAPTAEIAKLRGARFALAPEIPAGREFDLATFKALTGGDIITARPMYQLPINFLPTHKFILSGQHFPKVENSHDVGFLRRFLPVIFDQDFSGDKSDEHLKDKLRVVDELSGVLNILVQECLNWQSEGLITSAAMQKTRDEYIEDNDFISNFIADNCEFGADFSVTRKEFLDQLKATYSQAYRFSDRQLTDMVEKIDGIIYKKVGRNKVNSFLGLQLLK